MVWIPLVFIFAARRHWVTALILVLVCILTLRLQNELMVDIGHPFGFLPFLTLPVLYRGYIIYGALIFLFLLLSSFSRRENTFVYIAAAIGIYVLGFGISMGAMFL